MKAKMVEDGNIMVEVNARMMFTAKEYSQLIECAKLCQTSVENIIT